MVITVIPVSIGMYIKKKKPGLALRVQPPVKVASAIFIALVILGVILKDKENIIPYFKETGLPALLLNLITLTVGFVFARLVGLNFRQSATVSIEGGIQNGTLAIAIASSVTLLNNPDMAIPGAVYSLIMFVTGAIVAFAFGKRNSVME